MFALLTPTNVLLDHFQTRQERHGEDLVTQGDLKITWTTNNRAMEMLAPGLRAALFGPVEIPPGTDKPQGEMDLPVDELPRLLFPTLAMPLKLELEQTGMHLVVDYGLGGTSNLVLPLVKFHKAKASAIEGGSVAIEATLSTTTGIDEDAIGKLSVNQQREITITLTPPEAQPDDGAQQSIDGTVRAFLADHPNAAQGDMLKGPPDESDSEGGEPDATDAFVAAHGKTDDAEFEEGVKADLVKRGVKPKKPAAKTTGKRKAVAA